MQDLRVSRLKNKSHNSNKCVTHKSIFEVILIAYAVLNLETID